MSYELQRIFYLFFVCKFVYPSLKITTLVQSLVGSMVGMLDQSESTRRYATVIKQLLPVVTRVYAAEDPQQAVNTLVSSVLGPYLHKVIYD